jgi:hypothetical protein
MTTTSALSETSAPTAPAPRPRPTPNANAASRQRDERLRLVQLIMFTTGGVLMPLGILAICLGWYGSSHAHYEYDQNVYLISGGVLGLGLVFLGGFIYFGAWLSRMATDQRQATSLLTDAMMALADVVAVRQRIASGELPPDATTTTVLHASELVTAGDNTTVHRRDCALISSRPDLHDYVPDGSLVTTCRVCKPEL